MHAIVAALRAHDVQPALEWARTNREALSRAAEAGAGSSMEWQLHRLRFLTLLRQVRAARARAGSTRLDRDRPSRRAAPQRWRTRGSTLAGFRRARRCASAPLFQRNTLLLPLRTATDVAAPQAADVRRLMGSLLFAERFDESPYAVRGPAARGGCAR